MLPFPPPLKTKKNLGASILPWQACAGWAARQRRAATRPRSSRASGLLAAGAAGSADARRTWLRGTCASIA
eukprot:1391262-Pyramimonas_sp.AAC.1